MIKAFKKITDKIIASNSKELHTVSLKLNDKIYGNQVIELKELIKNENKFELIHLEIIELDYVKLSIKWRGAEFGKYHIY